MAAKRHVAFKVNMIVIFWVLACWLSTHLFHKVKCCTNAFLNRDGYGSKINDRAESGSEKNHFRSTSLPFFSSPYSFFSTYSFFSPKGVAMRSCPSRGETWYRYLPSTLWRLLWIPTRMGGESAGRNLSQLTPPVNCGRLQIYPSLGNKMTPPPPSASNSPHACVCKDLQRK